jgi:ribosome-associated translation inhibitor RaiA
MRILVSGHGVDVGETFRSSIVTRIETLLGDALREASARVTLTKNGHRFDAHVDIHAGKRGEFHATGSSAEPRKSFDKALKKLVSAARRQIHRRVAVRNEPRNFAAA